MTSTFRWYVVGLLALFSGYVALEYYRPKPVDWRPTLINKHKIPYGTYVLYDQLPRLLGTDTVETIRVPIYNQLTGTPLQVTDALAQATTRYEPREPAASGEAPAPTKPAAAPDEAPNRADAVADTAGATAGAWAVADSSATARGSAAVASEDEEEGYEEDYEVKDALKTGANYLFVNTRFRAETADAATLLRFVAAGNDVFIVAEDFGSATSAFLDTLGVSTRTVTLPAHAGPQGLPVLDSVTLHFTNPALAEPRYTLPGADANVRFDVDSGRVGRTLVADEKGQAALVRLDHGRGHVYLCSVPIAFTNQFMLRPATSQFAATALSYLPARPVWWDEYQKQGRVGDQSLLRIVKGSPALNTAFYLLLVGGVLFVLVEARRRQRVIPTIKPLPNTTLQFTRTVASLYQHGSSHARIAEKKVGLFVDYLRTRFQETTPDFGDADFRERLSQKSGIARPRVDELLRLVNFARTAPQMTDQQLLLLSRALNDFKREAGR